MKRTTIFMNEATERDLQALARRQGRPMAALVREALTAYVAGAEPSGAPLPSFVGVAASGRTNTAETHEALLWRRPAGGRSAADRRRPVRSGRRR